MTGSSKPPVHVKAGDIVQFPGGTLYRIVREHVHYGHPEFQRIRREVVG